VKLSAYLVGGGIWWLIQAKGETAPPEGLTGTRHTHKGSWGDKVRDTIDRIVIARINVHFVTQRKPGDVGTEGEGGLEDQVGCGVPAPCRRSSRRTC